MRVRLVIKWKLEGPPPASIPIGGGPVSAAPVNRSEELVDHRYHKRLPVKYRFSVYSEDQQAGQLSLAARGINMSRSGVLIETEEPLPIGSMVYIKVKELGLVGMATVRHCTPKGMKFRIGLHFSNPLTRSL